MFAFLCYSDHAVQLNYRSVGLTTLWNLGGTQKQGVSRWLKKSSIRLLQGAFTSSIPFHSNNRNEMLYFTGGKIYQGIYIGGAIIQILVSNPGFPTIFPSFFHSHRWATQYTTMWLKVVILSLCYFQQRCIIANYAFTKSQRTSDSLDIGTFITNYFLGHLETPWA